MKKMLVTGGSGFLGSRVVKYFSETYEICAPSHGEMDITDMESVRSVIFKFRPDVVIHCAAMADVTQCRLEPETSRKRNVDGSVHMAAAAKEAGAKCLLCSSDQVYFAVPSNIYAKEKLAAEEEGLKVNPDCVFMRLTWMYDPALTDPLVHSDFFTNLYGKLSTNEDVFYALYDKRGITDVNEVIKNMEKAINLPGGIYDFGSPNDRNMYETVVSLFSGLGLNTDRVKENKEAFSDSPRDITVKQDILNSFGIYFDDTTEALIRNFRSQLLDFSNET